MITFSFFQCALKWLYTKLQRLYQWLFKPKIPGYHFFIFDTETTGLSDHDRIVEFGVRDLSLTCLGTCKSFCSLVNPGRAISNSFIHGITNEMVVGKPSMQELFPKLIEFVESRANGSIPVLLAHNSIFDQRMLFNALEGNIQSISHWQFGCTIQLFKPVLKLPKNNLAYLSDVLGIKNPSEHRVMGDIETVDAIVLKNCTIQDIKDYVLPNLTPLPTVKAGELELYERLLEIPTNSYRPSKWEWAKVARNRPKTLKELNRLFKPAFVKAYGSTVLELIHNIPMPPTILMNI